MQLPLAKSYEDWEKSLLPSNKRYNCLCAKQKWTTLYKTAEVSRFFFSLRKTTHMLRKLRIAFAIIFFTGITLLFLDFSGTIHTYVGWMAKMQLLPAVLALNVVVVIGLLLLSILFGRAYCSVINLTFIWR